MTYTTGKLLISGGCSGGFVYVDKRGGFTGGNYRRNERREFSGVMNAGNLPAPQFYSPDPHLPSPNVAHTAPFYPYFTAIPLGVPPTYPYPPYVSPYYLPPLPQPATGGPSTPIAIEQVGQAGQATDGRMLIQPDGDTFNPSKQPMHKIRDIIRSMYDAPYISWKKAPKEVREMWFREFEKDFCWLPQHNDKINMFTDIRKSGERPLWIGESVWAELNAAWGSLEYTRRRDQNRQNRASDVWGMGNSFILGVLFHILSIRDEEYTRLRESQPATGEGSSTGSAEYSEYRIWSQAVEGMQHRRVYGLSSQAHVYEGQSSTGSSFASSSLDSSYGQQIAALIAELEQVRKAQSDWQLQMQQQMQNQQSQLLDEIQKMREQFSQKNSDSAAEETESE
ncbi:hypothetical protein M5K25_003416 [Dendrobium thyrsiflorum]|uniref:Uncharacterized protein n=1 Tax=Dendrobium thyrsiflorum TaxID=117978 RepID=A0ABD0VRR1_DENTH